MSSRPRRVSKGEHMEAGQILMYVLQTLITIALGLVGWSVKNSIAELKNGIKHNADDIKRLEERHSSEMERMKEKFERSKKQRKRDIRNHFIQQQVIKIM